jgi:hypothetical protein
LLDQLITSKTRMKLLMKFFTNSAARSYLRGLSQEMGESTNAVRLELNRLSSAGLLHHEPEGNTVVYRANTSHPFFKEIQRLVMKYMGLDNIVELVSQKLGNIELALITGDYAKGIDSGVIDLVIVGEIADKAYLNKLQQKAEEVSGRKIRTLVLTHPEFEKLTPTLMAGEALVLLANGSSHFKKGIGYWDAASS